MTARVLLIEDDRDVRALSQAVLSGDGFDVVAHPSGSSALDWVATGDVLPDVVVLDVQMPEMDGWTVLDRLRADERTRGVPVLMCTVKAGDDDRRRASRSGAEAYLSKPFTIEGLLGAVRDLLEVERAGVAGREEAGP